MLLSHSCTALAWSLFFKSKWTDLLMPKFDYLENQYSISRRILQGRRAQLTKLGSQPVTNRYLIYRMTQDRINIRVYLVGQIW